MSFFHTSIGNDYFYELSNNKYINFATPPEVVNPRDCNFIFKINTTSNTEKIIIYIDTQTIIPNNSFSFYQTDKSNKTTRLGAIWNVTFPINGGLFANFLDNYNYTTEVYCNETSNIYLKLSTKNRLSFKIMYKEITRIINPPNNSPIFENNKTENNKKEDKKDIDVLEQEDMRNKKINEEEKRQRFLFFCIYGFIASNIDLILLIVLLFIILYLKNKNFSNNS
jgi:hypothetical protein